VQIHFFIVFSIEYFIEFSSDTDLRTLKPKNLLKTGFLLLSQLGGR